jgi:hypothetical protein
MHIQDLQEDKLDPEEWKQCKVMQETIIEHDSEKGSSKKEVIVQRRSDNRYFRIEYTQWLDHREYESDVAEVFPITKTITVYE